MNLRLSLLLLCFLAACARVPGSLLHSNPQDTAIEKIQDIARGAGEKECEIDVRKVEVVGASARNNKVTEYWDVGKTCPDWTLRQYQIYYIRLTSHWEVGVFPTTPKKPSAQGEQFFPLAR